MKISNVSSGPIIQYHLKTVNLTQEDLAKHFEVTRGAISRAINGDADLRTLRLKIILYIQELQSKAA